MLKRFNMLALIVLLVFQTMLTPVAATAQGVVEQVGVNTEATEGVDSSDEVDVVEEAEGTKNEDTDVDEESEENEVSEEDSKSNEDADVNKEGPEGDSVTTDTEKTVTNESEETTENTEVYRQSAVSSEITPLGEIEEELIVALDLSYTTNNGTIETITGDTEIELNVDELNGLMLGYSLKRPQGLIFSDGDTYKIPLPSIAYGINAEDIPISIEGTEVGTYSIIDNEVVITFNSSVNSFDDVEMQVLVQGDFNTDIFETEEEVVIEVPYREGGSFTATIKAERLPYEGNDSKSAGEQYILGENNEKVPVDRNPEYVDWTVIANDSMDSYENASIIDELGDHLEIIEDSIVVHQIIRNYKNEEIDRIEIDVTPTITDSGFELDLGEIDDPYEITYTTRVSRPEGGGTHKINNNARIILDGNATSVSDDFEGTWSGDLPIITKNGGVSGVDTINWIIEYNYGKENLGLVKLTDELSKGEIDLDLVRIYEVDTDVDGNVTSETLVDSIEPILEDGNVVLPNIDADGKAYRIEFTSSIPVGLNEEIVNTITDDLEQPNSDSDSVAVNTIPSGGKTGEQLVDEGGFPYIEWTITMNSEKLDVPHINVKDVFSSDHLDFDVNNSELFELYMDEEPADNFTIRNYEHSDGRTGFELNINNAGPHEYKFIYRTYYTELGMSEPEVANEAEIVFEDSNGVGIGEAIRPNVSIDGPTAGISKSGKYVLNSETGLQEIEWTIDFNISKVLLQSPTITDNFTSRNYKYISDSFSITENGQAMNESDYDEPNFNENGFVIQINKDTNATYQIKYRTTADDVTNLDQTNEVILDWQGGDETTTAKVDKRDPGISKTAEVVTDENGNKSINWKITFNNNRNVIHNFKLVDTYAPSTATISNFELSKEGTEGFLKQGEYYTLTNPENGLFKINIDQLEAVPYELTYTTTLSPEEERQDVRNSVDITYTGGDDSTSYTVPAPKIGVTKEAIGLDEESDPRKISWSILANTDATNHYVNLVDAVLEDTIPEDQRLVQDSIEVQRVDGESFDINEDSIDTTNNTFSIKLPNGPYQYEVTFETEILEYPSRDANDIDRYTNSTTLTNQTNNEGLRTADSDDAFIRYYGGGTGNHSVKTGEQNAETENIDWSLTVNPDGLPIKNAVIKDTLNDTHSYVDGSIILMDQKGEPLEGYEAEIAEDNRSFTIDLGEEINEPYKLSYSTRLNANLIGSYPAQNTIELWGGTTEASIDRQETSTTAQQWFYGGGGSGRTVQFELNKENSNGDSLADVEFKLERQDLNGALTEVDAEIKTNENGVYISGDIRAGRYILSETNTPVGFKALENPIYFMIGYAEEGSEYEYVATITNSSWVAIDNENASAEGNLLTVINDFEPVSVILQAFKVLEGNKELDENQFEFELVDVNNGVIDTKRNNADGTIIFNELTFDETGEYKYEIREVKGSLSGVSYDAAVHEVTVTVTTDDAGKLETIISYGEDEVYPAFTNTYEAAPTQVTFEAKKLLEGLTLSDGQFEFELVDEAGEVIQTALNDAEGNVTFEEIEYSTEGEHTYTIREVESELKGITFDKSEYRATVKVTDNLNGNLEADVSYEDGPAVFTNTYTPEPDRVVFEASKILEGQTLQNEQFEFELVDGEGNVVQTVSNNAEGQVTFEEITFEETGEYIYTIREVKGDLGGITYDSRNFTFEVTVEDNEEGNLIAEVTQTNGPAAFTNSYESEPDSIVLEAKKVLQGKTLVNGQFEFELVDDSDEVIQKVTNNSEGQIIFDEIFYDEAGEYEYIIREVEGTQLGVTYDTTEVNVTVSVTDDDKGSLVAVASYGKPAVFTNNYQPKSGGVVLEASKVLNGQALVSNQFNFELVDEFGEVIDTAKNDAAGKIIFDEITFDAVGEYTYTIQEVEGTQGGMTYDTNTYKVVVNVVDEEGQLVATTNYESGPVVFINHYEASPDSVVIEAKKVLEGQNLVNDQFTFQLLNESEEVIQTITNNANGQVIFDEISFDEVGVYNYSIREVEGTQGGVTYDSTVFNLTVEVEDNAEGQLIATTNYIDGPVVFTNNYTPSPDSIVLEIDKILEGQNLRNGQFEFELMNESEETIQTATNNAGGQVIFDEITYDEVGEYKYTIREVEGTQGGIIYDSTELELVVTVTDDGEGQLTATLDVSDDLAFTNTYVPAPDSIIFEANKVLEGQELKDGQFTFELIDADGVVRETTNNAIGQVIFDEITYDEVGEYIYTIREMVGVQGGVTYDSTEYTAVVTVTDDDEGKLHAEVEYSDENIEFNNTYTALDVTTAIEASKTLDGQKLLAGQFEFELVDEAGEVIETVTNNATGEVIFSEITYSAVGEYTYIIREVVGEQGGVDYDPSEFEVIVTIIDNGEGQLIATEDYVNGPAAFNNKYSTNPVSVDLVAKKVLEDRYIDLEENEFTFEVVDAEGNVVTTATNNINGEVNFAAIEFDEAGSYEFTIREIVGGDGNINYDQTTYNVTVVVTDNNEGQLLAEIVYAEDPIFVNKYRPLKVSVGDYVWIDENKDGLQDKTDTPLKGVVLTIEDEEGNPVTDVYGDPVDPQTTDENGYYSFDNLPVDKTYTVKIDREASEEALEGLEPTLEEVGDDNSVDSSTWEATSRHLVEDGERDPTLDFGFIRPSVSVGDYVWIDENKDGLQDETDTPLEGVVLTIEDGEGNPVTDVYGDPVGPQTTDKNGYYIFENLPINKTYIVRIDREASAKALKGYVPTLEEVGDDKAIDSSTWFAVSVQLTVDGQHDPTLDFGFVKEEVKEEPVDSNDSTDLGDDGGESDDSEKPTDLDEADGVVDKDTEEGKTVPKTATNIYNLTLIGFGLMLLGVILFLVRRKRIE